jgi:hypothetical protein
MAYYIFLKSLRSLEEFRKILMTKFLLNLLLQIFKALVNSKIQFLSEKKSSSTFGPIGLVAEPAHPAPSSQAGRASPPGPERPGRLSPPPPSFSFLPQCADSAAASSHAAAPGAPRRPSPTPWSDRNEHTPLINSVMCFYSDVNAPPSSLRVTDAFMADH